MCCSLQPSCKDVYMRISNKNELYNMANSWVNLKPLSKCCRKLPRYLVLLNWKMLKDGPFAFKAADTQGPRRKRARFCL